LAKHATVREYIAALPEPLRTIADTAREATDRALPEATNAIRWAHPTWSISKVPVCYLKAASQHITLGFWKGASLDDPSGRLQTSGQVMAHVKLRTLDDVDEALITDWVRQAARLETDGGYIHD
jgi:hypothetical protein